MNVKEAENGYTPLMLAAHLKHVEAMNMLVSRCGALVDARDNRGRSALCQIAIGHGDENVLTELVVNLKARIGHRSNIDDHGGATCLHLACLVENVHVIEQLIPFLPQQIPPINNIEKMTSETGENLLHFCATRGLLKVAKYLLNDGNEGGGLFSLESIDAINTTNGLTCLQMAALNDRPVMVDFLMQHGADINVKNPKSALSKSTPLMLTAEFGCTKSFHLFFDEDDCDKTGVLHSAVRGGQVEIARFLIEHDQKQKKDDFEIPLVNSKGELFGLNSLSIVIDHFLHFWFRFTWSNPPSLCCFVWTLGNCGCFAIEWS